jgi:hypothetical protein
MRSWSTSGACGAAWQNKVNFSQGRKARIAGDHLASLRPWPHEHRGGRRASELLQSIVVDLARRLAKRGTGPRTRQGAKPADRNIPVPLRGWGFLSGWGFAPPPGPDMIRQKSDSN